MAPSQLRGELDLATADQMEEAIFKFMRRVRPVIFATGVLACPCCSLSG